MFLLQAFLDHSDRHTGPVVDLTWCPVTWLAERWHRTHLWGPLKDSKLLWIGQGGVQRKDEHGRAAVREVLCNVSAGLAHCFNFLLTSKEHQDVLRRGGFLERDRERTLMIMMFPRGFLFSVSLFNYEDKQVWQWHLPGRRALATNRVVTRESVNYVLKPGKEVLQGN